jgi:non-heme chloroperoxidase
MFSAWLGAVLIVYLGTAASTQKTSWRDPSPHTIQFVSVDKDVQLEVLDWGGAGRPMVLLSGLGGTAHIFDNFALQLTSDNHVYGITRRGYGASTLTASGYDTDRLGDDVLAVIDSLKLDRPVLVGASFGGAELSSVASRHPDRLSALVYLDAAYPYAFDDGKGMRMDQLAKLELSNPGSPEPTRADRASVTAFQAWLERSTGFTYPEAEVRQLWNLGPDESVLGPRTPQRVPEACLAGTKKFTEIRTPALAIYADPPKLPGFLKDNKYGAFRVALESLLTLIEKQATSFENGVPGSHVVRLANASHTVFQSNEADVLREMRAFLAALK